MQNKLDISNTSFFNIYYEDTDFSGFVYHANYLKFFERAREHMIGVELLKSLFKEGLHFVVSRAELEFKAPARFGDNVCVKSEAHFSKSPRVVISQNAYSVTNILLTQGSLEIVLVNNINKPTRIPNTLLESLADKQKLLT